MEILYNPILHVICGVQPNIATPGTTSAHWSKSIEKWQSELGIATTEL